MQKTTDITLRNVTITGNIGSDMGVLELQGNILFSGESVSINSPNTLIIKSDVIKKINATFSYNNGLASKLTKVEFLNESGSHVNSSITSIGADAFKDATLQTLVLPSNLNFIGSSAFANATPETLVLPSGLEEIGQLAFASANPTTFVMSPVIKTIGFAAFSSLIADSIIIPSTIESIDYAAFISMPETSVITVNKAEGSFTTETGWNGDATVIYNP